MLARLGMVTSAFLLIAVPALAQWDSGSDGSDGPFSPTESVEVDLGLAASLCDCDSDGLVDDPCEWSCPSPVAGQGVYDAKRWVVVFKFTSIQVPDGVTVTFKNHPSGAPVAWLAGGSDSGAGDITIAGIVDLDGDNGGQNCLPVPCFNQPGPGGFGGGQRADVGSGGYGGGFGPGSKGGESGGAFCNLTGGVPGHATLGNHPFLASGSTYGSDDVKSLIGGSGGTASDGAPSGGAGGGAMLVAASNQFLLEGTGRIWARGGAGAYDGQGSSPGSGGAIRIRAADYSQSTGSQVLATPGAPNVGCTGASAGLGYVRVESGTYLNSGSIGGRFTNTRSAHPVFAANPPMLKVVSIDGLPMPGDPEAGILSTELNVNSSTVVTIAIEATGIPVEKAGKAKVRIIPARGGIIEIDSTKLEDPDLDGILTATASVSLPAGHNEIQLRTNWQ